jgi:hypothetical protein
MFGKSTADFNKTQQDKVGWCIDMVVALGRVGEAQRGGVQHTLL